MTRNDQLNAPIRKHTSKVLCQQRGGAKPLWPPRIVSCALGLFADPRKHNLRLTLAWSYCDFALIAFSHFNNDDNNIIIVL